METGVADGKQMDAILRAPIRAIIPLRKVPRRVDRRQRPRRHRRNPIGNFCEIEGPSRWIDATAEKLQVSRAVYMTKNYATLFLEWKRETKSTAREMTFKAVRS